MSPSQYLLHHGFTALATHQPASRFCLFQWIEGGSLLAVSVLLIAVTVWLVHRSAVERHGAHNHGAILLTLTKLIQSGPARIGRPAPEVSIRRTTRKCSDSAIQRRSTGILGTKL